MIAAPSRAPGTGEAGYSVDRLVREYERVFTGLAVEGIDLALANRLAFYICVQTASAFASPSRAGRFRGALLDVAVFARDLLRRPQAQSGAGAAAAGPKVLVFFEGINPSVDSTLRAVLRELEPAQARIAIAEPEGFQAPPGFERISVGTLAPRGTARAAIRLPGAVRARQRRAQEPLLRRASLGTWLLRMALRTGAAAHAFRRLYDDLPVSALVTASDTGFWGCCATLEAARRGIPSVTLQHGMMAGETGYLPVLSDRIAVWGEGSARWLRERGVPDEKIVVTGAPRLDTALQRPCASRDTLARALGADPGRRWVVLATNPIVFHRNLALLRTAQRGVASWDAGALLLVKLHPSEDAGPYRDALGSEASTILVPHDTVDLYDLLAAAEAVLTFHSSVGLEAMMLGRPVVSLEAFGEENPLPYAREGGAAAAHTAGELARILREDVPPGTNAEARRARREQFVRDHLFSLDAKGAERVRALVLSLARWTPRGGPVEDRCR